MTRLIKSLLGYDRSTATEEEAEAYRVANEALQFRMNEVMRQTNNARVSAYTVTDAFGRRV